MASLQQIVALKYFGFSLGAIKNMMQQSHAIVAHLKAQQQIIKEQAVHLDELNSALDQRQVSALLKAKITVMR